MASMIYDLIRRSYRSVAFETEGSTFGDDTDTSQDGPGGSGGPPPDPETSTPDVPPAGPADPNDPFGPNVDRIDPRTPFKIPDNFMGWIEGASQTSGVPPMILAMSLYSHMGGWKNTLTPDVVASVAYKIRSTYNDLASGNIPIGEREDPEERAAQLGGQIRAGYKLAGWAGAATLYLKGSLWSGDSPRFLRDFMNSVQRPYSGAGTDKTSPSGRYVTPQFPGGVGGQVLNQKAKTPPRPTDINDVYAMFEQYLGRPPTSDADAQRYVGWTVDNVIASLTASEEGQQWRQYGPRIKAMKTWADQLYMNYVGKNPTTQELINAIKGGFTDFDKLEGWLRQQPYGTSNLGALTDARAIADREAMNFMGRKADPKELNWLLQNGKTGPDDISGFYEQLKERVDTKDPSFAWAADPKTWRGVRDTFQQIWKQSGLQGQVDPHLINQAIQNQWMPDDMQDHVNAMPAPGFGPNVTVGEVSRVRRIATEWQDHYLPGKPLTHADMQQFVGKGMGPNEIREYYRALPVSMHRKALTETDVPSLAKPDVNESNTPAASYPNKPERGAVA